MRVNIKLFCVDLNVLDINSFFLLLNFLEKRKFYNDDNKSDGNSTVFHLGRSFQRQWTEVKRAHGLANRPEFKFELYNLLARCS